MVVSHKDESMAKGTMNEFAQRLESLKGDELEIVGYGKCQIEYLGGKLDMVCFAQTHTPCF